MPFSSTCFTVLISLASAFQVSDRKPDAKSRGVLKSITVYTVPADRYTPFQIDAKSDFVQFTVRIPKALGPAEKGVEIEELPFVTLVKFDGIPQGDGVPLEEAIEAAKKALGGKVVFPDVVFQYVISDVGNAPDHLFLLFIPKNADLATLRRLYPEEKSFKFPEAEARRILGNSALRKEEQEAYLELLQRGGAVVVPTEDKKKVHLSIQPGNKILQHVIK